MTLLHLQPSFMYIAEGEILAGHIGIILPAEQICQLEQVYSVLYMDL